MGCSHKHGLSMIYPKPLSPPYCGYSPTEGAPNFCTHPKSLTSVKIQTLATAAVTLDGRRPLAVARLKGSGCRRYVYLTKIAALAARLDERYVHILAFVSSYRLIPLEPPEALETPFLSNLRCSLPFGSPSLVYLPLKPCLKSMGP